MENRPWNPLVLLIASWLVFALSGLLTTVCAGDWKFLFAGFMLASGFRLVLAARAAALPRRLLRGITRHLRRDL